jgi:hypothetical protein
LGGPVRTSVAAAVLDDGLEAALLDGVLLEGVLLEGALLDGVLLDGVLLDGVLLDGALLDGVLLDGVLLDGVLLLGADEVGAVVGVVVVELDVEVVELDVDVVVGGVSQPVTQKTLCLTSAPCEPSALIVSLTWNPCCGWGSMPVKSSV